MNLNDFNIKKLEQNLSEDNVLNDFVNKFISELKEYFEKNSNKNVINIENQYSSYWDYQNFIEDNVAANIGISRWSADIKYCDELSEAIDNSILELAEKEGTLYRKQFIANGPTDNPTYRIDKFENGKIEHLILTGDKVPKGFENEDIIFQYKADGSTKIRTDLKEEAINLAIPKTVDLKELENERNSEYKKEGHIYEVYEDDGYIFLNNVTEEQEFIIEDIDFVTYNYKGDGKYQVINGEYQKIN